jgi:hypothetical protein
MATLRILKKPEDQIARKVIMKGQVMQIGQVPLQSRKEMPFIQSKYPPSTLTLKKILGSAKFIPVLVFIPTHVEADQLSRHMLGEDSFADIDGGRLTEVLKKGDGTPKGQNDDATITFGDVTVDFVRMEAFRKKEPVVLTTLQLKTLRYLTRHARRVISRDELLGEVWGYEHYPTTRSVDNIIVKLRQKLEPNPSRPTHFRTIYGTGYKFVP